MKTILAIGAHFDDIEIGIGGTLLRHSKKKDKIYLAVLCADEFRTGEPNKRLKEQLRSMKLLNISQKNLICLMSSDNDYDIIAKLDSLKPDIIYTLYEDDTHQDHRRCSKIGQSVGRKPNITMFFYGVSSACNFHPTVFVAIDFEQKLLLLKCYKSQIKLGAINIKRIKSREHYWGTMISSAKNFYAEGFIVRKMIYEV